MLLSVHPPTSCLSIPSFERYLRPSPKGRSYVAVTTPTLRTSYVARPQSARGTYGLESKATAFAAAVAFSESPSSSDFDQVYTPRTEKPWLNLRFRST